MCRAAQPSLSHDKLVLVIDDDPLVLEGMSGIFRKWGCRVITADSDSKALKAATAQDDVPDLIISDYHLANGRTGIATIEWLRGELSAQIPAFLISGDTDPATLHEAKVKGFPPAAQAGRSDGAARHVQSGGQAGAASARAQAARCGRVQAGRDLALNKAVILLVSSASLAASSPGL